MPLLNTDAMTTHNGGTFGFSGTRVERLSATEYTLVTIAVDCSSSMWNYTSAVESCLEAVLESCRSSPRADNLMVRVVCFNSDISEYHGFKLLQDCASGQYSGAVAAAGLTALCDAACDGLDALTGYSGTLGASDFDANGILFVITDGVENASTNTETGVKDRLSAARHAEDLESLLAICVGIAPDKATESTIKDWAGQAGFDQFVGAGEATNSTLARLAQFVSRSISAQSQQLGTGGSSQPLTF